MRRGFALFADDVALKAAEAKLKHDPTSKEYGQAVKEQGMAESAKGKHEEAAALFLRAAHVLNNCVPAEGIVTLKMAAIHLAAAGKLEEAMAEMRRVLRGAEQVHGRESAEWALAQAGVARIELMQGQVSDATSKLEEAMHSLHASLGKAHPISFKVQRLWATTDMKDWTKEDARKELLKTLD